MKTTSQQLLDVPAGVGRGELVDDVQRRLVVGVPDVDVHTGLQGQTFDVSGDKVFQRKDAKQP